MVVLETTVSTLRWSVYTLSRSLGIHLTQFAFDEGTQSQVVRGVVRLDESVVVLILSGEVP